jgi:hypothetical protein
MELQKDIIGKRIVFVNPPDLVSKHMLEFLTGREYEVYTLLDHTKIKWIASSYPGTLFFLNIDAVMNEYEWEDFIADVQFNNPGIRLGIFSFKITEPQRVQHYLMELGISCGFIMLKQGVQAASEMMLKILYANEAKGRRKYIRYQCSEDEASMNFKLGEIQIKGTIQDISSVGMSFFLDSDQELVKNQVIKDIQLRLKGVLVNANGVILGQRVVDGQTLYVALFNSSDQKKTKERIHSYIQNSLQKDFEKEFA